MTRKILRAIGWVVGGLVALTVALYLMAVVINWRDQEPSAAAVRFESLYRDRPAVADDDNAFIDVMGFDVAPGEDVHQMGLKRLAWMREANGPAMLDPAKDPLGKPFDPKASRHPTVEQLFNACKPGHSTCAAAFGDGDEIFERWMASERWLLERYRALLGRAGWREEVPSDLAAPLPSYQLVMNGQKLWLLNARRLAAKGDHAAVKELLEADVRFWRKVLEASDILISKMIATAALNRHFELGNLILRELPPASAMNAMPAQWHAAISDLERSMLRCLVGEWIFAHRVLPPAAVAHGDKDFFSAGMRAVTVKPFFQPQATMNRLAEYNSRTAEILNVPVRDYEAALNQATEAAEQNANDLIPPSSIYNIVGEILLAIGQGAYGTYFGRVADIEGVRRAALAAVMLREAKMQAGEVAAALTTASLRNPYNDSPFEWDEDAQAILFRGLEAGARGEHRLYY
jgi:hypothetical protein